MAGVLRDQAHRRLKSAGDDLGAEVLLVGELEGVDRVRGREERDAAARDGALSDRGAGGVERVLEEVLVGLHLGLRLASYAHDRDATRELREALFELLAVVVARGALDLGLDLDAAILDGSGFASALDDGARVLCDADLLGRAEVLRRDLVEGDPELVGDRCSAGQGGDVAEVGLATLTEARRLHGADVEDAAQLVHDERRERLALDVLGDDEERRALLSGGFEHRQELTHVRDLLVVDEDQGVGELGGELVQVGREVRREEALVELHALDDAQLGLHSGALFDGDDALVTHPLEGLGEELACVRVVVCGDHRDVRLVLTGGDGARLLLDASDGRLDGLVDAVPKRDRADARREVAQAL